MEERVQKLKKAIQQSQSHRNDKSASTGGEDIGLIATSASVGDSNASQNRAGRSENDFQNKKGKLKLRM